MRASVGAAACPPRWLSPAYGGLTGRSAQVPSWSMSMEEHAVPPALKEQLESGESLLWWGRPRPLGYVAGGAMLTVPLGLLALISAYTWAGASAITELPLWSQLFLGLLLLFALHMILLRPLLSRRQAEQTYYGVTNRRALAICTSGRGRVFDIPHNRGELLVLKGPHRSWKVQFGRTASSSLDTLIMGRAAIPGFYGLESVEEVARVLKKVRRSGKA